MKFEEVLPALRNGARIVNSSLSMDRAFIVRQVPAVIPKDVIPKMTSLPDDAKQSMSEGPIEFVDQALVARWDNSQARHIATSWVPTIHDLFREDWTIA